MTRTRVLLGAIVLLPFVLAGTAERRHAPKVTSMATSGYLRAVWVAQAQGILKIGANDGAVRLELPDAAGARAVAVDPRRERVWAVASGTLRAYSLDGQLVGTAPIPGAPASTSEAVLVARESDGTLWTALQKTLHHFDPQGVLLGSLSLADAPRALAIDDARGLLWLGGGGSLTARDGVTGLPVRTIDLGKGTAVQDLDVDPVDGALWVALADRVRRLDPAGAVLLDLPAPQLVRVAAARDGAWLASSRELVRIDRAGTVLVRTSPLSGQPADLLADPLDGSTKEPVGVSGQAALRAPRGEMQGGAPKAMCLHR